MIRRLTPEEKALWKEATEGVQRYKEERVSAPLKRTLQKSRSSYLLTEKDGCGDHFVNNSSPMREQQRIVEAAYGHTFGVERLRQNKAKTVWPEAALDLHGLTKAQATLRVQRFFYESQRCNRSWVKVITGKSGILFTLAPQLLRENGPFVSGYLYARANDGGWGALYVRIRKG